MLDARADLFDDAAELMTEGHGNAFTGNGVRRRGDDGWAAEVLVEVFGVAGF